MLYDVHTHAFHPKIADKATAQLKSHYQINPVGAGTVEDLNSRLKIAGIDRAFVHSAATTPAQVVPANDWALTIHNGYENLEAFGTIHPGFLDWESELNRLKHAGIRGLKLHPDFQKINLDDPRMMEIFEHFGDEFLFMFHIGDIGDPQKNCSSPHKLAKVLDTFPQMTVIAAHFGGLHQWQYVVEQLKGRRFYMDTSSSFDFIEQRYIDDICNVFGKESLLFGSDYPLYDPLFEMNRLKKRLKLNDTELKKMMNSASDLFHDIKG